MSLRTMQKPSTVYVTFLVIWFVLIVQQANTRAAAFTIESHKEYTSEELLLSTESRILANDSALHENSTQLDFEVEGLSSFDDDVIELNVGGERITTLRSTLTAVPDSTLALMFAKSNSSIHSTKDALGAVFFDFNPEQFRYLLDQLRTIKRMPTLRPYEINFDVPKTDSRSNFSHMVSDLGLNPERFLSPLAGAHVNLPVDSLVGWRECYRSTYDAPCDLIPFLVKCFGRRLLIGCRPVNSASTLTLAGVGTWQDIAPVCSQNTHCVAKIKNGTAFYVGGQAWGFEGRPQNFVSPNNPYSSNNYGNELQTSVHLNPCDSSDQYSEYRLCWSLRSSAHRGGGDRCGATKNLHNDANWERVAYHVL